MLSPVPNSSKKPTVKTKGSLARRTTVLHVVPALEAEPQARAVVDLATLTHRGGWRPLIASSGGALVVEAERSAIRHTKMPVQKRGVFSSWRCRVQLEALFHRERPDLIHAHGIEAASHCLGFCRTHSIPLLIEINNPIAASRQNKRLLRKAMGIGATFCVPSDFMATHLQQDLKLLSPSLYRVAPGVDCAAFDPARITAERVQALASAWRLPETATVIVTAAPVAPGMGHKFLLQALSQIKRPDLFTVILGKPSGDFGREILNTIKAYHLEGQVVMADYCADWPAACWLAGLFVAPNALPRGATPEILSAQAMGRPAIVSNAGANNAYVKSGETAWVVPKDDLRAFATALDEATNMTTDQKLDLAARTRAFVAESFPQTAWSGAMFELYSGMLG